MRKRWLKQHFESMVEDAWNGKSDLEKVLFNWWHVEEITEPLSLKVLADDACKKQIFKSTLTAMWNLIDSNQFTEEAVAILKEKCHRIRALRANVNYKRYVLTGS